MGIYGLLKRSRRRFNENTRGTAAREYSSPSTLGRYREVRERIIRHLSGRVLDVGCGDMTFRPDVLANADSYEGLDRERRSPEITYVGDAQDMRDVPSGAFDGALCLEVLEHVPEPARALAELYRILKPGGTLIVSVPHLSRLHEEPFDFYRYTKYGLRHLLESARFDVVEITARGGIFSFFGHQLSTVTMGLAWQIPGIRWLAFALNRVFVVAPCMWLDRVLEPKKVFALGYVAVARKSSSQS